MVSRKYTEEARRLQPFMSGNAGDVTQEKLESNLGAILLNHGGNVSIYDPTDAGLTKAAADAVSGDSIEVKWGTYSIALLTIPAGVTVQCAWGSVVLNGSLKLNTNSLVQGLVVVNSGSSSGPISAVIGCDSGMCHFYHGSALTTNSGTGDAYGFLGGAGTLYTDSAHGSGVATGGGEGYGVRSGAGDCYLYGGQLDGTTAPIFDGAVSGETLVDTIALDSSSEDYIDGAYATTVGIAYRVQISGTYAPGVGGEINDAQYHTSDSWSTYARYNFIQFSDSTRPDADDTTYSASHIYNFTRTGDGAVISLRVSDTLYTDNSGTLTANIYDTSTVTEAGHIYVSSVAMDPPMGVPLPGDRGAYRIKNYPNDHAEDIGDGTFEYHKNPSAPVDLHDHSDDANGGQFFLTNLLSTGASDGQVPTADGAGGIIWEDQTGTGAGDGRRYLLAYNYYIGSDGGTPYQIGLAKSGDGRSWTVEQEPIIVRGTAGAFDDTQVKDPYLLEVNGVLWLYYSGKHSNFSVGLSRSFDGGLTWTKYGQVMAASQAWENGTVQFPTVLYDQAETDAAKRWKMWYGASSWGQAIGYAYSADGITWTKYASNPVLSPGSSGQWDDTYLLPGAAIRTGAGWTLFYNGKHGSAWQSGLATFTDPASSYTRGSNNPILKSDGIKASLTADLTSGSTTATVADSSIFPVGCPVWIAGSGGQYLTRITAQASATTLTLADAAPATFSTGGTIRSTAYNSLNIRGVHYDGGYIFSLAAFQPFDPGESGIHETSMLAYANPDLTAVRIDYSAGLLVSINVTESRSGQVSRENPNYVDLYETRDRYKVASGGGSGTVTSIATGTGLTGGPITTTGTIALADTAVTPGTYTNATITVDQQGRITAASSGSAGSTTHWEPVTNGDATTPEIVFDSGDIVLAEVSN